MPDPGFDEQTETEPPVTVAVPVRMGLDYANPPATKTHLIVCSGGCAKVLGTAELHIDHPDPVSSTSGYICEDCTPGFRAANEELFARAQAREDALRTIIDRHLAEYPEPDV